MFPIKYIDNNLVWNKDNEVFAYSVNVLQGSPGTV